MGTTYLQAFVASFHPQLKNTLALGMTYHSQGKVVSQIIHL